MIIKITLDDTNCTNSQLLLAYPDFLFVLSLSLMSSMQFSFPDRR